MTEGLQNCNLNGSWCGGKTMASSTSIRTSWAFRLGNNQHVSITVRLTFHDLYGGSLLPCEFFLFRDDEIKSRYSNNPSSQSSYVVSKLRLITTVVLKSTSLQRDGPISGNSNYLLKSVTICGSHCVNQVLVQPTYSVMFLLTQ